MYHVRQNVVDVLAVISEECLLLRGLILQLERLREKSVLLGLGFCKDPSQEISFEKPKMPKLERLVKALEMDGANPVLLVDLRNECRREVRRESCLGMQPWEAEICLHCKRFELVIAMEAFDIEVRCALTFSECWDGTIIFPLCLDVVQFGDKSRVSICSARSKAARLSTSHRCYLASP